MGEGSFVDVRRRLGDKPPYLAVGLRRLSLFGVVWGWLSVLVGGNLLSFFYVVSWAA